jgi:hypothetical protein
MAKLVFDGVNGKLPEGVGPNAQPGVVKEAHGGGRQDGPEDPGMRQVKRVASWGVTDPAEFPIALASPNEPC